MADILMRLEKFNIVTPTEQQEIIDFAMSEIRTLRNTLELMARDLEKHSPEFSEAMV